MKRILVTILAAAALAAALPFTARAADNDAAQSMGSNDSSQSKDNNDSSQAKDSGDSNPAPDQNHDGDKHERHPAYLHALADLRTARWMLKHRRGDWKVAEEEDEAWRDIDKAIAEIKRAAIDDGKDVEFHASVDEHEDHAGRLHRALDLLRKTRDDLSHAEENGRARGLKRRAFRHIDHAIEHVRVAIHAAEHEHEDYHDRDHRRHHDD